MKNQTLFTSYFYFILLLFNLLYFLHITQINPKLSIKTINLQRELLFKYITIKIPLQMSNQPYSFQFHKPRLNNPTYLSISVASSLSFYNPSKILSSEKKDHPNQQLQSNGQQKDQAIIQPTLKSAQSDFSLPKINKMQTNFENKADQLIKTRINSHNLERYGQNIMQLNAQNLKTIPNINNDYRRTSSVNDLMNNKRQIQTLSKNPCYVNFNQKDIFMKQGHSYNIITYQPKDFNEHIKKYPKLSLEEKDQYFRMRYINDQKYKKQLNHNQGQNPQKNQPNYDQGLNPQKNQLNDDKGYNPQKDGVYKKSQTIPQKKAQKMAGMPTYKNSSQAGSRYSVRPVKQPYAYLNRISNMIYNEPQTCSEGNELQKSNRNPRSGRNFDMKILNHMDELNYYC